MIREDGMSPYTEMLRRQLILDRIFYEGLYWEAYFKALEREREIRELERLYADDKKQSLPSAECA